MKGRITARAERTANPDHKAVLYRLADEAETIRDTGLIWSLASPSR